MGSRMFSIADTIDAIMSDRPYRPAQPFSAARDEISRWSGRQFDPDVVKVFLAMPESIWQDLRKEINGQIYRVTADVFTHRQTHPCLESARSPLHLSRWIRVSFSITQLLSHPTSLLGCFQRIRHPVQSCLDPIQFPLCSFIPRQ